MTEALAQTDDLVMLVISGDDNTSWSALDTTLALRNLKRKNSVQSKQLRG